MKKNNKKALSLSTQTLRNLGSDNLLAAGGRPAGPTHSCVFKCAVTDGYACTLNGGCTWLITYDGNC